MDTLQAEINADNPSPPIYIHGVNQVGRESANDTICNGRDLPWLQETADQDVWGDWDVTYRDVIILDPRNEVFAVYNLTTNSLADADNRAALRELLLAAGR